MSQVSQTMAGGWGQNPDLKFQNPAGSDPGSANRSQQVPAGPSHQSQPGSHLGPYWVIVGLSWAILEPSCPISGQSWSHLGASWGILGRILGHLGPHLGSILEHLGIILSHLRAILEPSWGFLGHIWAILEASWAILGNLGARNFEVWKASAHTSKIGPISGLSWSPLGSSWGHLGTTLEPSWAISRQARAIVGHLRAILEPSGAKDPFRLRFSG
jgi:hypothetical protein